MLVSNRPTRPDNGTINAPRLGDPITGDDAPISLVIDAPYLWICAAPMQYTSGFVAVFLCGSQFSRHIAP